MEYNAASVKFLLWHVETKETAKLLQEHSFDEIRRMVLEDNIYQQKSRERAQSEFWCNKKRLQAKTYTVRYSDYKNYYIYCLHGNRSPSF